MKIQVRDEEGASIISIHGNMTGGPTHFDRFHANLRSALETENPTIIIDLSQCGYVASPGVGMIMAARTSALNRDRSLKLVVDTERIRNLFNLLHLFRVLDIYDTLEKALEPGRASADS